MEKLLGGKTILVNEEGYLKDVSQWDKNVANDIANEEGITLTETHFKVLEYLQKEQKEGKAISIRSVNKSGVISIEEFYSLFPGAPLKKATKIAGIPKPTSCV